MIKNFLNFILGWSHKILLFQAFHVCNMKLGNGKSFYKCQSTCPLVNY